MTIKYSVDWEKTGANISNRLSALAWKKDVAPIVDLSESRTQHKLKGERLSIEELCLFATFFGCSIEDLLVFEQDKFVEPVCYTATKRERKELATPEEISEVIDFNARHARRCEIQNLAEFFLYLPLIPREALQDVGFRCIGNLSPFDRHYFIKQMNHLYKRLPDNAAKEFADSYRDNVLRVKGDGELQYKPDEHSEICYFLSGMLFSGQISEKEYEEKVAALTKDESNDAQLLAVATQRMAHFNTADTIPAEEVYRSFGISAEDIAACDEVEFE